MANSDRKDNVELLECINDVENEVADFLIDILQKIDAEYDALVKDVEENLEPDTCYEIRNYTKEEKQYFVPNVVEQKVSFIDEMKLQLEEKELDNNLEKIHKMLKTCQREKEILAEKRSIIERKLNIEKKKIDSLNQDINDILVVKEKEHFNYDQLKILTDDLDKMVIAKAIYPDCILLLHTACNELQANIKEMEEELSKYADLPPDYGKAREKLADVRLQDQELESQIRSIINKT